MCVISNRWVFHENMHTTLFAKLEKNPQRTGNINELQLYIIRIVQYSDGNRLFRHKVISTPVTSIYFLFNYLNLSLGKFDTGSLVCFFFFNWGLV